MYLSFMLNNILMIFLLIEIYSCEEYGNCSYGDGNLEAFLGNDTDTRKEKCFLLSYSFGNGECCFFQNRCIDSSNPINSSNSSNFIYQTDQTNPTDGNTEISTSDIILSSSIDSSKLRNIQEKVEMECPKKIGLNISNNCGMVGIYMPEKNTQCNGISLVQGYCCFVKIKDKNENKNKYNACLRAKQLNKDKNKVPAEIEKYVQNKGGEIESVECGQFNLKLYWILNFILSLINIFS